jgi:hypothetical protein
MKSIIFWEMTPCNPMNFNRRFGGTYRLHLYQQASRWCSPPARHLLATYLLAGLQTISAHDSVLYVIYFIIKIPLSMLRSPRFLFTSGSVTKGFHVFLISSHVSYTPGRSHPLSCNHCNIFSLVFNENGCLCGGGGGER